MIDSTEPNDSRQAFINSLDDTTKQHLRNLFLITKKEGRSYLTKLVYKLVIVSICCTAPFILVCAIIQTSVLGLLFAVKLYGLWWIASLGIPFAAFFFVYSVVYVLGVFPGVIVSYIGWKHPGKFSWIPKLAKKVSEYLGPVIGISLILLICMAGASQSSMQARARYGLDQKVDLPSITQVATQQTRALSDLSESGNAMLRDLDNTEREIDSAKKTLESTLTTLSKQEKDAASASDELKTLSIKEQVLRDQLTTVGKIVDGQSIPTTSDIEKSLETASRKDQAWNFLWAIPAGIISIFIWELAKTRVTAYRKIASKEAPSSDKVK